MNDSILEEIVDSLVQKKIIPIKYREIFLYELDRELKRYTLGMASSFARKAVMYTLLQESLEGF